MTKGVSSPLMMKREKIRETMTATRMPTAYNETSTVLRHCAAKKVPTIMM